MKRMMTAVCFSCALGVVGVSASQTEKMAKGKMDKDMKSMTVTGCVSEKDGHMMLTNAMMTGDMKADIKANMKGDMKPMSYDLMGGELTPHVGHKVEVMGMMDSKMMMKGKKMDKDKMPMGDMHGTINVASVKMISTTCP